MSFRKTARFKNANKVTLLFEWGGQPKRSGDAAASPKETRTIASAAPPSGKERKPTVITWCGPLELRPVGDVVKPNKKKYESPCPRPAIDAGRQTDHRQLRRSLLPSARADRRTPGQWQQAGEHDVGDGETILADSVLFDRPNGVADLMGKGTITQPYRGGSEIAIGGPTPAATSWPVPAQHAPDDFIQWTKSVAVLFGESRCRTRCRRHLGRADQAICQGGHLLRPRGIALPGERRLHAVRGQPARADGPC